MSDRNEIEVELSGLRAWALVLLAGYGALTLCMQIARALGAA